MCKHILVYEASSTPCEAFSFEIRPIIIALFIWNYCVVEPSSGSFHAGILSVVPD